MKNYVIINCSSGIEKEIVSLLAEKEVNVIATYYKNEVDDRSNVKYINFDVLNGVLNLDKFPEEIHGLAYCPGSINLNPFHRFTDEDFIENLSSKF